MNILILELGGSHFENIYALLHLLKLKQCRLHLICNEKLVDLLNDKEQADNILPVPNEFTLATQLKTIFTIRRYIKEKNIDAVIIGTTEITIIRNLSFFLPKINITGIVHNAKKLEGSFTISKIIFRRVKKFLVFGDHVFSHLKPEQKFKVSSFFAIHFPPVNKLLVQKQPGEKWIIFPGIVDGARRNYQQFFHELEISVLPAGTKIILLGFLNRQTQQSIETEINRLNALGKNITWFDHYLGYDLFHSYIQQADVLIPLYKTEGDSFYADTRVSGTNHLGIAYHLPFLLPESYKNEDVKPYTVYYKDNKELMQKIKFIAGDETILKELKANYSNTDKFDAQKQAGKLYQFLKS
ncbi:MAG TPA: hypothetical protein PLA68_03365 [Panacibacter sp.]|nr:hypothetical protein [Panacibacter sp.]